MDPFPKSVLPTGTVAPGTTLTYTIGYSNTGDGAATNVVITDTLPAHTSVTNANGGVVSPTAVSWTVSRRTRSTTATSTAR